MEVKLYNTKPKQSMFLTYASENFLRNTARWGRLLALVGFVIVGWMGVLGVCAGKLLASMSLALPASGVMGGGFFAVFYLLFTLLYFFPVFYLYKFSSRMQDRLHLKSEHLQMGSLKNLKSLLKFVGVLTIVVLGFYQSPSSYDDRRGHRLYKILFAHLHFIMGASDHPYELPQQQLILDDVSRHFLLTVAKWGKNLAAISFVLILLLVLPLLYGLSVTGFGQSDHTPSLVPMMLLCGMLYSFPTFYLFRFSRKMEAAFKGHDQQLVRASYKHLKALFRYVGILTLVVIGFYAMLLLGLGIGIGYMP